ncbi:MAG: adenylyltransferase/cytidyltransferase family protein [Phycisphaerales bacterium]|nr:adenylyltransferase/cytidyltransferase family protein [Phycisphaerales bacterium]
MHPQPSHAKILPIDELLIRLAPDRSSGKSVVHCHGCFDIVHPGHVRYLEEARRLGDILVVSLTGDQLVTKGPGRPYIPQELRAENLAALQFVDWVVIDPHPTACELIARLKPDIYIKGREYATSNDPRFLREKHNVEQGGGRVLFHTGDVVFSSTRLLAALQRDDLLESRRLRAFCERHAVEAGGLYEVMNAIADLPVLVVGDAIRERYVHCDAIGIATDAPVPQLQRVGEQEFWGGAAAVALQLAALGARPTLLTGAGREPGQRDAFAELGARGVGVELLPSRPDIITRTTILADEAKALKLVEGHVSPLDSALEQEALAWIQARLPRTRLLVWSDDGYGMASPGLVRDATLAAQSLRLTVAAQSPGARGDLRNFHRADLILATERQLREAMHDMSSSLPAVAWNLLSSTSAASLIVSLRKTGLMAFSRATADGTRDATDDRLRSDYLSSQAAHFVDALAIEHAALGVSALARSVGASDPACTYLACGAAAISAERSADRPVTAAEMLRWLAQRPELHAAGKFVADVPELWMNKPSSAAASNVVEAEMGA